MKVIYRSSVSRNTYRRFIYTGLTQSRMKKIIKYYAKKHNLELEYEDGKLNGANGDVMDVWIGVNKKTLRFIHWDD